MIKAIIFDCFGVLVAGTLEQFIDKHFARDQKLVQEAHDINMQASRGLMSYEQQIQQFAIMAGISVEQTHREMDANPRNDLLLSYIAQELKGAYKIGFLSNASEDVRDELFTPEDLQLFDDFVLSYAVHLAKPDQAIYELAAQRLGVTVDACLFVDDIETYVIGAQKAGMKALQYRSLQKFKDDLERVLST